jgi:hypothetical protein
MAAYGIPEADIARVLGVSKPTLRKHCGTELDTGAEFSERTSPCLPIVEPGCGNGAGLAADSAQRAASS